MEKDIKESLGIDEELEEKINKIMRNHYGGRYYDEYSCNVVTSKEFNNTKELILKCIEVYKNYNVRSI